MNAIHLLSDAEVALYAARLDAGAVADVRADLLADPTCGPPLRAYLAVSRGLLDGELSPADRFYNRYFWFVRFAAAHRAKYGPDAGIDQQKFRILEQPECDVDWAEVERLSREAASD